MNDAQAFPAICVSRNPYRAKASLGPFPNHRRDDDAGGVVRGVYYEVDASLLVVHDLIPEELEHH